jgi:hypothetical protein
MLFRFSFLAVWPVLLLAVAVLAAEPIYDRKTGHPWDQAREIFYTHRFPTGEIYEHPHAFAPPWREFVPFVHATEMLDCASKGDPPFFLYAPKTRSCAKVVQVVCTFAVTWKVVV